MNTRRGKRRDPLREQFWAPYPRGPRAKRSDNPGVLPAAQPETRQRFSFWRQELARRDGESTPTRMGERLASSSQNPGDFLPFAC